MQGQAASWPLWGWWLECCAILCLGILFWGPLPSPEPKVVEGAKSLGVPDSFSRLAPAAQGERKAMSQKDAPAAAAVGSKESTEPSTNGRPKSETEQSPLEDRLLLSKAAGQAVSPGGGALPTPSAAGSSAPGVLNPASDRDLQHAGKPLPVAPALAGIRMPEPSVDSMAARPPRGTLKPAFPTMHEVEQLAWGHDAPSGLTAKPLESMNLVPLPPRRRPWALSLSGGPARALEPFSLSDVLSDQESVRVNVPAPAQPDTVLLVNPPERFTQVELQLVHVLDEAQRWTLSAGLGLRFSSTGMIEQRIYPHGLGDSTGIGNPVDEPIASGGPAYLASGVDWKARQLTLPVWLTHYLRAGRSSLSVAVGGTYTYDLNARASMNEFGLTVSENLFLPTERASGGGVRIRRRTHNLHLQTRLQYHLRVAPRWEVSVGPGLRYRLLDPLDTSLRQPDQALMLDLHLGVMMYLNR